MSQQDSIVWPVITYSKLTKETLEGAGRKICSKLTIKTQERHQQLLSCVFIVNFDHIHTLLLTLSR